MSRAPRNQDRDAEIIARIKAGEPFPAIARTMGVTKNVVFGVCYRAGLSDPQRHAAATKANWQAPEFRERNAAAVKAAKAQQLCDRYGLRPDELDDFRAIKRGGFKPDEAARMIIASRKSEAA